MNEVKLFSPATVSNVSCGFDVLGFCLDAIGDEMIIRKTVEKGIKIPKLKAMTFRLKLKKMSQVFRRWRSITMRIRIVGLKLKFTNTLNLEVA